MGLPFRRSRFTARVTASWVLMCRGCIEPRQWVMTRSTFSSTKYLSSLSAKASVEGILLET